MKKASMFFAFFSVAMIMSVHAMDPGERTRTDYAEPPATRQHVQETAGVDLIDGEYFIKLQAAKTSRSILPQQRLSADGKHIAPKVFARMAAAEAERSSDE